MLGQSCNPRTVRWWGVGGRFRMEGIRSGPHRGRGRRHGCCDDLALFGEDRWSLAPGSSQLGAEEDGEAKGVRNSTSGFYAWRLSIPCGIKKGGGASESGAWDQQPPGTRSREGPTAIVDRQDARMLHMRAWAGASSTGASGGAWAAVGGGGPAWEERKRAEPKKTVQSSNYSNIFKVTRIDLIKQWSSGLGKISNKICIWSFWNKEQLSLLEHFKPQARIWIKIQGSSRVQNPIEFDWMCLKFSRIDEIWTGCSYLYLDDRSTQEK
jgi:hypothetical protein